VRNLLVRLIGWPATVLHGDPCLFDRWLWLRRHLRRGQLRTLDAGCGSGVFTTYAAKLGNDATGVSFDARNNQLARARSGILGLSNVRFVDGDLRELDALAIGWPQFDQIVCLETLEHIRDDRKLMLDLVSRLAPKGQLLLTTPFKYHRPLFGDAVSVEEDGGHVRWGYTHDEIRNLADQCGLDVVSQDFVSGVLSQKSTNLMRRLNSVFPLLGWAASLPLRLLRVVDRPVTRLIGYPYLCIAVVARKRSETAEEPVAR
jgi:SAM-dependent methyltransferase